MAKLSGQQFPNLTARDIRVDTRGFDNNLATTDRTVQDVLDTIDDALLGLIGGVLTGDLTLDDGVGDSPKVKFIGGSHDDYAEIFLDDDALQYRSDLIFKLGGTGANAQVIFRDLNDAAVAYLDMTGELNLTDNLVSVGVYSTGQVFVNYSSTTAVVVEDTGVKDDVFVVDTVNGRVGINSASPSEALDVYGNINVTGNINGISIDDLSQDVADNTSDISTLQGLVNQDVTSGASPNFDGTNFTGIPDGALVTDYVEVGGDTMTGDLTLDDGVGDSPAIKWVSASNDDWAWMYLEDNPIAGESQLKLRLPGNDTGTKFRIVDSDGIEIWAVDGDGNVTLSGTVDGVDIASWIDQDVSSGASPNLDGTNFSGIPDGALVTDYVEVGGDTMTGNLILDDGSGNSPEIHFVGGSNDDTIKVYLYNSAVAGESDLFIDLPSAVSGTNVSIRNSAGNPVAVFKGNLSTTFNAGQISTGDVQISGATKAALFFTDASTDRVGIGTASPTKLLDVDGDVVIWGNLTLDTGSTVDGVDISAWIDQDVSSGASPTFTGANFTAIDANDVNIADAGGIITATEVEGALQENRTAINLNTTHRTSTGADHSYINQSVVSGASPSFVGTNFTSIPDSAMSTDYVEVAGDIMAGDLDMYDGTNQSPSIFISHDVFSTTKRSAEIYSRDSAGLYEYELVIDLPAGAGGFWLYEDGTPWVYISDDIKMWLYGALNVAGNITLSGTVDGVDVSTIPSTYLPLAGGTLTGDLTISKASAKLTLATTSATDPTLDFSANSGANRMLFYLDESETHDWLIIEGQTATVDTIVKIKSDADSELHFEVSGADTSRIYLDNSKEFRFVHDTQDADFVFRVNDGGVVTEIMRFDADVSQVLFPAGYAKISTSGATDPTLVFSANNGANSLNVSLDESDADDIIELAGQTGSVATKLKLIAQSGQWATSYLYSGSAYGYFQKSPTTMYIGNATQDADVIFRVNDGGSTIGIMQFDADISGVIIGVSAGRIGFFGATPIVRTNAYTFSNRTADRSFNCDSTSTAELADVLATLIYDLQQYGLLQ